jgi:amino acid permease
MSEQQWREAIRFTSDDWGWVIMSIGMAIGAGIVFLPVQVGLTGLWVFLISSAVGYPAMYLFQRLFVNTLADSRECSDYPGVITSYLGKNWGVGLGMLYFVMLVIWVFVYAEAITNDSASFIHTFGWTKELLSEDPLYGLALIVVLVAVASRGEKLLFRVATFLVLTKLCVVAFLGAAMVPSWSLANMAALPPPGGTAEESGYHASLHPYLDPVFAEPLADGDFIPGQDRLHRSGTLPGHAGDEHRLRHPVRDGLFLRSVVHSGHGA